MLLTLKKGKNVMKYPTITVPRFRDVDAVGALPHLVELDPQAVLAEGVQAPRNLKIMGIEN